MSVEVRVPVSGEGAQEYLLSQWYAADGDPVVEGESLLEVETAKATFEVPSPATGILSIAVDAGAEVVAHQLIASVGVSPETTTSPDSSHTDTAPEPAPDSETDPAAVRIEKDRVKASPRARAAARASGTSLDQLEGTGPGGRILSCDVLAAPAPNHERPQADDASAPERPTGARAVIGRRMTEAAGVPTVTLHRHCDADALRALVTRLRERGQTWELPRVTVGDVVAYVVSRVLRKHPALNAHWVDGGIRRLGPVDLGIAVDSPWGLVVPVIRGADHLSLTAQAASSADLAARARSRIIQPGEVTGSSFTISNLGALGVEQFSPLLNVPEVAILGVGAITGSPAAGTTEWQLSLSLTFDHRAVDGAPAARLLRDIAEGIADPDTLLAL